MVYRSSMPTGIPLFSKNQMREGTQPGPIELLDVRLLQRITMMVIGATAQSLIHSRPRPQALSS